MDKNLEKNIKIVIVSVALYLLVYYLTTKVFELQSYFVYAAIGILMVTFCCLEKKNFLVLGISIPLIYNIIGLILGWFNISFLNIVIACIEQGVIMLVISKMIE